MKASVNPQLPQADLVILQNLLRDIKVDQECEQSSTITTNTYNKYNDECSMHLLLDLEDEPTVFTSWDWKDIKLSEGLKGAFLRRYVAWAQGVVRNPIDVVFLTHILLYLGTSVPSAFYMYYRFSWFHAIFHCLMQLSYCGSFTLMLHNHIHNNGLLKAEYAWFDHTWPYILGPLMGHTWNSYFYHHIKHHHVENNGPNDLSSTIRYQRDELVDFLIYVMRFVVIGWIELPLYFIKKGRPGLASRTAICELSSYTYIYLLAKRNFCPTLFTFIVPLVLMRVGLMIGNFGQHALVDDVEPESDFRSSITLIDVPSNRHCFNDGWHTSHHLNPLRHWRDHQRAFLKTKEEYKNGGAIIFQNIDYLEMTYRLLRKDYAYLANCIVPIGDQVQMNKQALENLLRTKTRRFTEEEIQEKYYSHRKIS